jgi:tubby-related protein 1
MLQCNIRRDKSGFKRLAPRYYLNLSEGQVFLLGGKKRLSNKTSNYLISMDKNDLSVKSQSYLGKVRSNFMGTEFNVFDTGMNPSKKKATRANIREQLGVFLYVSST